MTVIPERFAAFMRLLRGEAAEVWLAQLPSLLAICAARWDVVIEPVPFPNLSYNYVAPATCRDGTAAVVKIGMPNRELFTEMAAMQLYNGEGTAPLLAVAEDLGAMLLARVQPGTPLTAVAVHDDSQATHIAASLITKMQRPVPSQHDFPTLAEWLSGLDDIRTHFGGGTGPLPEKWVIQAQSIAQGLLASAAAPVLLHGDLHHDNILAGGEERWVVIDPKGVIGDPAYEVARFLHNPPGFLTWSSPGRWLARRVDMFAELLAWDRQRILGWGFCDVMLGAWWCAEDGDNDGVTYALGCADLFDKLLG